MTVEIDEFCAFESKHSTFDIRIDDVAIWERIRFNIYREINEQSIGGQAHTTIALDTDNYITGAKLWLRNLFYRNPFLSGEHDFLFVGHQRRKREPDSYWWDIYCDPIHEECSLDSVHFEKPYLLEHLTPARTDSLRYLELIEYGGTIQRKLGLHRVTLTEEEERRLKNLERAIEQQFKIKINLVDRVVRLLRNRRCRLWLYRRLLDRVDPEVVVIVVSYGKETFIEACQSKDIPVVELQHGVIHPGHLGYSYPEDRTKETFPDYLLTWGDFWAEGVELPIPEKHVIPVGYPYLEQRYDQYTDVESKDQIIFISQGTIGEELSRFALEVEKHPDFNHDIIYKLHPGEYDRWKDEYPWLTGADFEIVDSSEPPLYELFADSTVQVGVGSTAVYEGLVFDLDTYVYDCAGASILSPLIGEGAAEMVSSVDEFMSSLENGKSSFDKARYFAPNATENICRELRTLSRQGEKYGYERKSKSFYS
jgi:hypothetical protein